MRRDSGTVLGPRNRVKTSAGGNAAPAQGRGGGSSSSSGGIKGRSQGRGKAGGQGRNKGRGAPNDAAAQHVTRQSVARGSLGQCASDAGAVKEGGNVDESGGDGDSDWTDATSNDDDDDDDDDGGVTHLPAAFVFSLMALLLSAAVCSFNMIMITTQLLMSIIAKRKGLITAAWVCANATRPADMAHCSTLIGAIAAHVVSFWKVTDYDPMHGQNEAAYAQTDLAQRIMRSVVNGVRLMGRSQRGSIEVRMLRGIIFKSSTRAEIKALFPGLMSNNVYGRAGKDAKAIHRGKRLSHVVHSRKVHSDEVVHRAVDFLMSEKNVCRISWVGRQTRGGR